MNINDLAVNMRNLKSQGRSILIFRLPIIRRSYLTAAAELLSIMKTTLF